MRLKVLLPERILLDKSALKITAEGENGSFTLLPRHVDFVSVLVPGLLSYVSLQEQEEFLALDQGILIKKGEEVMVSSRLAVIGPDLGSLEQIIQEKFRQVDEKERQSRSALARLEADLARRFFEWSGGRYE